MALTVTSKHYKLPLRHPFTISRYTVKTQSTVIISMSHGDFIGYGEATVNPYYNSTVDKIEDSIKKVASFIKNFNVKHPNDFWQDLEPFLVDDYFTLCAIDCAYWDLYAKIHNRTFRSFFDNQTEKLPLTNYTIGIDSIENMKVKILEKPWPIYKIKLGTEHDVEIIKSLRKITNSVFRIDANASWTAEETLRNIEALKHLNVEFIEQPLKADDWQGMKLLKERSELPIIADESCQRMDDVAACAEVFHGINIKLMKCGGITPALEMIKKARDYDLLVMAGCMTESSIGISNLTQLAGLLDYIDADGAMLLKKDIAEGICFENGKIVFSQGNGSGAKML
ncbi:dipeptide epimerase [Confluentibacter flavum]|uniref:Dipeptide epimerase n=1 Tax=Confluentibacter flavum TaxID=1909700 RepID=A0A2N3HK53_9FLAO|nr:dipeptide epimerase [Confluentibacter flavum]PKQ45327.1 dipeptide epimerase [Confluentibacter flavum]